MMTTLTKAMTVQKMDDEGKGLAIIAKMSAIDSDGDTYAPGAFNWKQDGHQWVQILPAHNRRAMPLGKARVYEDGDTVYAELSLNLDTQAGREWHAALKFDLANGDAVQEWSYGFDVIDADFQQIDGKRVRVLKKLDVHEVSPVLKGAGVGTGTVSIKHASMKGQHFSALIADLAEMATVVSGDPQTLSATGLKQLEDVHTALGQALKNAAPEECVSGDTLLAGYLQNVSRKHLKSDEGVAAV